MSEPPVLFALDGAIATLTLNRPSAGNTIDIPMARALVEASLRCRDDPAIRCVVLTGAGPLFSGGGDVRAFADAGDSVAGFLRELAGTLHVAVSHLMRMPKPLLVLVNGPAAGAGLSLAVSGDVVLAARSAHFTAAYGAVGLSPDGGLSWHLPRLVGLRRAQEMIIANRRVPAAEAEAIGLVTRTVDDEALAGEGAKLAARLAASATGGIGAARALLLNTFEDNLEAQLDRELDSIVAAGSSAEAREGIAAFLAGRKPRF